MEAGSEAIHASGDSGVVQVKWSLESWREVVVLLDKVLCWEKSWHAGVVAGFTTFFYLLIWCLDLSFLSLFSVAGIILTVLDYTGPKLINQVFGADSWNGAKEKRFELVCKKLTTAVENAEQLFQWMRDAREKKPAAHLIITVVTLFSLAWIGATFDNFFLAYLVTLVLTLLPGLDERGILQQLTLKINDLCKGKAVHLKKAE